MYIRRCLLLLCLYTTQSPAMELPAAIESCMQANLPMSTSTQSIELRARDRSNYVQVLQADIFWKRQTGMNSRVLMHFSEPVDVRGARFLIVQQLPQNEMYIYIPGLFKVRRITSRKISISVLGTDFSYEDFERLYSVLTDMRAEQFPDVVVAGRPVHVLMSYPDESSGYVKIATYIDKENCIALKTEFYERGHRLRKRMTIDPINIRKIKGLWYPAELLMQDIRDRTETRLIVNHIDVGRELDNNLFNADRLKQEKIPSLK